MVVCSSTDADGALCDWALVYVSSCRNNVRVNTKLLRTLTPGKSSNVLNKVNFYAHVNVL